MQKKINGSRNKIFYCFVLIMCFCSLSGYIFAQQSTTTQYVYDANSRLRAVIHPSGEVTVYDYDDGGNITAVRREQSNILSILYFTPNRGGAGQEVIIYGTGFSTTATENAVKINDVNVNVLSATLNKLTVEIPVGASSGNISITNSLGTVTSEEIFTIIQSPVINSVNPGAGKWGDIVTISGANFDPVAGYNIVKFNETDASIISASADTIVVRVPDLATSGPVTVSNDAGTGASPENFYVIPVENNNEDIFYTSEINYGVPKIVPFQRQNKIAMLTFQGVAEQRVSLKVTVPTSYFGSLYLNLNLSVRTPNNSNLISPVSMTSLERGRYVDTFVLPFTGVYTIYLDKTNYPQDSGNATVNLYNVPPDASDSITIDGEAVEIANAVPGHNARLTFNGSAGQKINLLGEVLPGGTGGYFSVLRPDGTTLVSPTYAYSSGIFSNNPAFLENVNLPVTGQYTIFIDPANDGVMTFRTRLASIPPNVTGTVSTDGSDAVFTTTVPGQNVEATFDASAGQVISLKLTNLGGIFYNGITLESPSGWRILNNQFTSSSVYFMDATTLTESGTYKVTLNPYEEFTGSMKLNVYTVPPDSSAVAEIGGDPVGLPVSTPGQNAFFTFEGTAGQKIAVKFSNFVYFAQAVIKRPDETAFGSTYLNGGSTLWENITLSDTGTYTVSIDPSGATTSDLTVEIFDGNPPEINGSLVIDGPPLDLDFAVPFRQARLTFEVSEADLSVRFNIGNNTVENGKLSVINPDGSVFRSNLQINSYTNAIVFDRLPEAGTYSLVIDPDSDYTGQMTVSLASITDINETLVIDGSPATVQLEAGQNAYLTFSGTAGQRVLIKFGEVTIPYADLEIIRPDQTVLESGAVRANFIYDYHFLPETGIYKINLLNTYASSGNIEISATTSSHIPPNMDVNVQFLTSGQTAEFTFNASAGTDCYITVPNYSSAGGTVKVYNPDGSVLTTMNFEDFYNYFTTQNSGVHRIEIIPPANDTGFVQLYLSSYTGGGDTQTQ